MTQPILLTGQVYAVEVPEGATGFNINKYGNGSELNYWLIAGAKDTLIVIDLPAGNWQLIGTTKEVTNGIAMGLVESHYYREASYNPILGHYQTSGSSTMFKDYIHGRFTCDNPVDSLRSLLKSKGLDENKNYVLIKKL